MKQHHKKEHAGGTPRVAFVETDPAGNRDEVVDFDFDEVDRRNGWIEPGELRHEERDEIFAKMGEALAGIMEWIGADNADGKKGTKARAAVVQYMIRPETYGSQTALAERLEVTKQYVNKLCVSFRDTFDFINSTVRSDEARERMARSFEERAAA